MTLPTAQSYAAQIVKWLSPHCLKIEVAGSILRRRPECNDIDLVVTPRVSEEKDMLGAVIRVENFLHAFLKDYIAKTPETGWVQGEELKPESKQFLVKLRKCRLDIFLASEANWTTRFLSRTGSRDHNTFIAAWANYKGMHWHPYEGLRQGAHFLACPTEQAFYEHLDLPFVSPQEREIPDLWSIPEYWQAAIKIGSSNVRSHSS